MQRCVSFPSRPLSFGSCRCDAPPSHARLRLWRQAQDVQGGAPAAPQQRRPRGLESHWLSARRDAQAVLPRRQQAQRPVHEGHSQHRAAGGLRRRVWQGGAGPPPHSDDSHEPPRRCCFWYCRGNAFEGSRGLGASFGCPSVPDVHRWARRCTGCCAKPRRGSGGSGGAALGGSGDCGDGSATCRSGSRHDGCSQAQPASDTGGVSASAKCARADAAGQADAQGVGGLGAVPARPVRRDVRLRLSRARAR